MRWLMLAVGLLATGCGGSREGEAPAEPQIERRDSAGYAGVPASPTQGASLSRARDGDPDRAGNDWCQFLGPLGTSVSSETGIIVPWPTGGLPVLWQKPVGTGYGMPAISRGRLFQFDRHGDQARLSAFDSDNGGFLWKFEYPTDYEDYYGYNNGPRCCPVVDGDRVYIFGAEGMLHCVRAADGHVVWKVDTTAEFHVVQNFFGVGSAPVIEGDLLIVQIGGSPQTANSGMPTKGNGTGIVAFDRLTGKVRYKISDELASYASPVLATIHGRRWCFVLARGGLVGFEAASGKIDFHFPWRARTLESVNASNPIVVDDRVFISECYGPGSALLKIKPGGYDVLWTDADKRFDKSMKCHWNTPVYHDGYLYGCSGRHPNEAELRCIELASGQVMWSHPDLTRSSLLMVDGHFICLTEDGKLLLLKVNPHKYEEISRMELYKHGQSDSLLRPPCWAAPILSHGRLYIRGHDNLLCFQLIPPKK